jgi:transcriptional regulator with XRE-family HTH domain
MGLRMKRKLPVSIRSELKKLGEDLKKARLRRRLKMTVVADRAGISLETLAKIQKGNSGVSIGNYSAVIFAIGLGTDWMGLAGIENDRMGRMLDEERIPLRARD